MQRPKENAAARGPGSFQMWGEPTAALNLRKTGQQSQHRLCPSSSGKLRAHGLRCYSFNSATPRRRRRLSHHMRIHVVCDEEGKDRGRTALPDGGSVR